MSYIYDLADTWNNAATTFTSIKMNVTDTASNAASLLMDLQVGGTSRFKVGKGGALSFNNERTGLEPYANGLIMAANGSFPFFYDASSFRASSTASIGWTSQSTAYSVVSDTFLTRRAAANLRLGAADAAAPVAQTLSVQSVIAGTSNTAGANLTITGSQGTGTGAGGSIIFQVAPAGSSGTAQNALATALTINSDLSASFATNIRLPNEGRIGNPNFYSATAPAAGMYFGNGDFRFYTSGVSSQFRLTSSPSTLTLGDATLLAWNNGGDVGAGTIDVILARDAANTLALRNGANAQFLRVYSTYTDASNYERGAINTGADFVELAAETAGTGDDNLDVRLTPAGTGNVRFGTHTGTADTAVSGYIEIKDAGGTIRKLAVIS